jgi:xylulokinase
MRARHVLAWDLGTSGAKVGIVTAAGEVLGHEFEPTPRKLLPDGGAEQRVEDWWAALEKATLRLLGRELVPRDSIAALGVTAQWSGTVAVDEQGRALHDAVIWMDARGAEEIRRITGGPMTVSGYAPHKLIRWVQLTGGAPGHAGKDPLSHILWLKRAHPEVFEKTHKFLEPKDYLTFRLTGRMAATFDSIALHWITDNRKPQSIDYDQRLLELAGLTRDKFPDLVRAPDPLGHLRPELCERFGLSRDVIVPAGAADVHSAAVGAGTTENFAAHYYLGTSAWLAAHVPRKKTDIAHNMAALPAAIPGRYLLLNEQETAGACLEHLRDKLLFSDGVLGQGPPPADVFQRFDQAAQSSPPGSRKLLFLPWLYGERTPVEDARLRGGFVNYSLEHGAGDVVRAVLEGVAYNARWLLGHVENFFGQKLAELRFVGGGAQSRLWSQILADVLEKPILRLDQPLLTNLRGAAFIAYVTLGELDFAALPERVRIQERLEPRPEHFATYRELYAAFGECYAKTRGIVGRLNANASERAR